MKNFEKYIESISRRTCLKSILNFDDCCEECDFGNGNGTCDDAKVKQWLLEEYKEPIQLSHDEYVILKNLPKEFEWIARDEDDDVVVYDNRPTKGFCSWGSINDEINRIVSLMIFSHIFKFIKWEDEEPYEIEKLIADYEKENENEV